MHRRVASALHDLARAEPEAPRRSLEARVVRLALGHELRARGWSGSADERLEGTGLLPAASAPGAVLEGVGVAAAVEALAALRPGGERRRRGVHYTPPDLAAQVVRGALDPLEGVPRVVDPACGAGVFLVATLDWLRGRHPDRDPLDLARLVHGVDLDPLAADAARLALWLDLGDPALPADALSSQVVRGDAVVGPGGPSPFPLDWAAAFPHAFDAGGFDAVVGNPPFGNAIEATTRRSPALVAWARQTYPPFAAGAYDGSLLFLARAVLHLLSDRGRYGLLLPTALLSSAAPWQGWMHARWRPDHLRLLPVSRFPGARVRTVAVAGGAGRCPRLAVVDEESGRTIRRRWPRHTTWYAATRPEVVRVPAGVPLGSVVHARAGCATGVAYLLRDRVVDDPEGPGPRLVTTGALDRWTCHWGSRQRFLGGDYTHPRWPAGEGDLPAALVRARDAQVGPKILVGGLTEVLEPWLDEGGTSAGVVSTWVLTLREGQPPGRLWEVLAALASATLTRLYRQAWGGLAMSGRQVTVKKAALLSLPVPVPHPELADWARQMQAGEGEEPWGHGRVAELLGRPDPEADWRWWRESFPGALRFG